MSCEFILVSCQSRLTGIIRRGWTTEEEYRLEMMSKATVVIARGPPPKGIEDLKAPMQPRGLIYMRRQIKIAAA
jgi:hypothetical protein